MSNKRVEGQRRYECLIAGCHEKGRIIGTLGDIKLTYCPRHRKKGERILNFLINSLMRYKLTKFLQDSKEDLFKKNKPELCPVCYNNIKNYINEKIKELDELEKSLPIPIEEMENIKEDDL